MVNVDICKKLYYFDLKIKFNADKEVLVIQGESGSGKTTVLDCIAGIKQPDEGEICIDDRIAFSSAQSINIPIKDRGVGYVFQNYALFPHMTVRENIRFGIESREDKDYGYSDYITDVLKIKHLENRYPVQLSGGEKQRAALARALSIKPKLLLLDEPFSALDSSTKKAIYHEFLEFKSMWEIDMILITHNDAEAKLLGDKVLKIYDGMLY